MTERELLERARMGDEQAFRALYDANVDQIFRVVFRMVGEEATAADLTQATFIRGFVRLEQFNGHSALSTWLHRIALSVTMDHLEKRKRRAAKRVPLDRAGNVSVRPQWTEPHLRDRLHEAIDGLDEMYRTVFIMHELEGFTHGEIADVLDIAVGTSKARLSRARRMLREVLDGLLAEGMR